MYWNHLNLTVAYEFAEVHGTQELHDEITRMQKVTYGLEGKKLVPMRRGLTVEIFEKHQMLEELLEGSCGKGKSHFKYNSSPAIIKNIIDTVYRPLSRDWKKKHPHVL